MKRQTKRRIMALVMAALMVVGLIPTGFTAITAKASAGKKYSFEASSLEAASAGKFKDSETVKAGTDDYFTLYMIQVQRHGMMDISQNSELILAEKLI